MWSQVPLLNFDLSLQSFKVYTYSIPLRVFFPILFHSGILKEQCNTDIHTPGCILPDTPQAEPVAEPGIEYWRIAPFAEPSAINTNSSSVMCSEKPAFESHTSRVKY